MDTAGENLLSGLLYLLLSRCFCLRSFFYSGLFCYGSFLCNRLFCYGCFLNYSCRDNLCTVGILVDTVVEAELLGLFCYGSCLYGCGFRSLFSFGSFFCLFCRSRLTSLDAINDRGRIFVKINGRFLDFVNRNGSGLFGSNYCSGNYGSCYFYRLFLIAGDDLCGVNVLKDDRSTRTKTCINIGSNNIIDSYAALNELFNFLNGNLTFFANVDAASRKVSGNNSVKICLGFINSTRKYSFAVSILINARIKSGFFIGLFRGVSLINRRNYCIGRIEHRIINCVFIICKCGKSLCEFFITDCGCN